MGESVLTVSPGYNIDVNLRPIIRSASDTALRYSPRERKCYNAEKSLEFNGNNYFRYLRNIVYLVFSVKLLDKRRIEDIQNKIVVR